LFKTHYVNFYLTLENGIYFNRIINENLFEEKLRNEKIINEISENIINLQKILMNNNILLFQDRNHLLRLLVNQIFINKLF
jgi:hypothetical protein